MIIDGKKTSKLLREELKKKVSKLKSTYNAVPGLTVILVGEDPPSKIYVKNKEKSAIEVGINSEVIRYPNNVEEKVVLNKITELNKNEKVSAILVQLPLPTGYDSTIPCTPLGCYLLIKDTEKNLNGKHAVIIGRSNLNGKPMTQLLLKENCTVTITHSKTKDLKAECKRADIIVAAVGRAKLVKADWVKKDAIVIDVGINKTDSGLVGDVDFDEVSKIAKAITPVPGGVGPMTIACLLSNTVECFKKARSN